MPDSLLDTWLARLDGAADIDLADHGHEVVPELLQVFTPDGFTIELLDGSWLRSTAGNVVAELTAELHPAPELDKTDGVLQRRIDTAVRRADHVKLELPPGAQGQGRGRTMLRRSVDLYADLGIEEVRLLAVDTGRYAWAAAGFAFGDGDARSDVVAAIEDAAELVGLTFEDLDRETCEPWEIAFLPPVDGVSLGDAIAALEPAALEGFVADADAYRMPLTRPGKLLLLGEQTPGWQGVLDLRPYDDNRGLQTLYDYTD